MIRVLRSAVIDAAAADLWRLLRDFNSHAAWHPAVADSVIEGDEPGDTVGAVRAFHLTDGGFLREQLIAHSDAERSLTYCILDAPLPLYGYVSTLRLRPVTASGQSFITWQSRFAPPPGQAAALTHLVASRIYDAGLAALAGRYARSGSRIET